MSFWKTKYINLYNFKTKIFIIIFLIAIYKLWSQNYRKANQIIYSKNNISNISEIKNLKKVVYTALLGNYDKGRPIKKEDGYDYIDTTFEIKGNLDEFLLRILTPKVSIYVLEHPDRNSVNNELEAVIIALKDTNKTVASVRNKYKRENFPDNNGLSENCLIIRKHNDLRCINYMNEWFNEIKKNSHRDQLSFNYILWKTGNKDVKYISKKYIDKYFDQNPYHLVNLVFKRN